MTEPWIERVIRDAQDQGRFDDVPGTGEPIPDLDQTYDPSWWARRWIERERRRDAGRDLVARVQREVPVLLAGDDKELVRKGLDALNGAIDAHNAGALEGPIARLDIDALLTGRNERCNRG